MFAGLSLYADNTRSEFTRIFDKAVIPMCGSRVGSG